MPARNLAAAVAVSMALTSCGLFGLGGCGGRYIRPVQGSPQATSCPKTVRFEDREYSSWCARVRQDLLGPVIGRSLATGDRYVLRSIDGVDPAIAVALREIGRGSQEEECGRWAYAPEFPGTRDRAERLADLVTVRERSDAR